MGLFNASATLNADVTLLLQIVVFFILFLGMGAKFKRNYVRHAMLMGTALVLHIISALVVMVPSLRSMQGLFQDFSNRLAVVILLHSVLGTLAAVPGILLVAIWAVSPHNTARCFKMKQIMRATISLWLIALVLGIYNYMTLYVGI